MFRLYPTLIIAPALWVLLAQGPILHLCMNWRCPRIGGGWLALQTLLGPENLSVYCLGHCCRQGPSMPGWKEASRLGFLRNRSLLWSWIASRNSGVLEGWYMKEMAMLTWTWGWRWDSATNSAGQSWEVLVVILAVLTAFPDVPTLTSPHILN